LLVIARGCSERAIQCSGVCLAMQRFQPPEVADQDILSELARAFVADRRLRKLLMRLGMAGKVPPLPPHPLTLTLTLTLTPARN